ncbi:MAG TPA: hypothetical protein VD969_18590 [Symbiobacteriaceae bacterium]|nr:hypothetical protein [Symbiobacteriaceae bacterium]
MAELPVALAVVGDAVPAWASRIAGAVLLDPGRYTAIEDGFNEMLASTRAPCILPVAAGDQLDSGAVLRLAGSLAKAPGCYSCAAGPVDQVRRDGTIRRVSPSILAASRCVHTALRLPTPILFRTGALRAAGGWRRGEACWEHRSRRHRALLARLLANSSLLAGGEYLGTVARVGSAPSLRETLEHLLFQEVTLDGPCLQVSGRIVAVTPDLVTLAETNAPVTLVPVKHIAAVARRLS